MTAKWKIILLVMLIIVSVSSVFLYFYIKDNRAALNLLIEKDIATVQEIIKTLEEENRRQYTNRIGGLIDYKTFPSRENMVRAFARHEREHLQTLALPFGERFVKENPNFSSFGWVTTDNIVCTRILSPERYGDNVSAFRPDIVEANHAHRQITGYMTAPTGLEYRLVQPVNYKGKHVGIVQFGLRDSMLIDAIYKKMDMTVAMIIPNAKFSSVTRSQLPSYSADKFTIQSRQLNFFQKVSNQINWETQQQ